MARVMVVDDDPLLLCVLIEVIMEIGHEVIAVSSGHACLTALEQETKKPDLITLDYMLTDMTGGEVLALIRESPSLCDIPVVFITASRQAVEMLPQNMYQELINKPFDIENIQQVIERYVC